MKVPVALAFTALISIAPASAGQLTDAPCWIQDAASFERTVWLLCARDQVFKSADEGATWRSSRLPVPAKLRAIAFLDVVRGFVVGDGGAILSTSDGGETWNVADTAIAENLHDVFFRGKSGWIAGGGGLILHSPDAGQTWTPAKSATTQTLEAVYFADAKRGWAAGWGGTIVRTVDGGETWEQARTPATAWSISSLLFRDATNGWAVGMFGQILRSQDGGATWKTQESPIKGSLSAIVFDRNGHGWITAEDSVLLSEDGGDTWRRMEFGEYVFLEQLIEVNGALWAVGPFGIHTRAGTEARWEKLSTLQALS
jgi:photosystem II stability/assembly factor-like uncharacterized protein